MPLLYIAPGTQSKPADVYLTTGSAAVLDISSLSTVCVPTTQGHALLVAKESKCAAHGVACHALTFTFIHLMVEVLVGDERYNC